MIARRLLVSAVPLVLLASGPLRSDTQTPKVEITMGILLEDSSCARAKYGLVGVCAYYAGSRTPHCLRFPVRRLPVSPSDGKIHMRIGVIGAGAIGGTLARHLARHGHQVSIANSRGPDSLTALAAEIGATPVPVVDAANAGEVVIVSIPQKAVPDL